MRQFINLIESASHDGNQDLVQYFLEKPVDMATMHETWQHFISILDESIKQRLAKVVGVTPEDLDNTSTYYDLPPKLKGWFGTWLEDINETSIIVHDDPQAAPAWMLMEPETGKLLPDNTPLIHFSDHPDKIKAEGFRFGVPDIDRIALTRENDIYGNVRRITSGEPGYNFAYMTDGTIDLDHRAGGYGTGAILFRSSGLLVHHSGDREAQVVFWGPSAKTSDGVVITRTNNRWITDGGNSDMSLNRLVRRLTKR